MTKKALRTHYLLKRQQISMEWRTEKSLQIAQNVLKLPMLSRCLTYHLFLSIEEKKEVDTSFILTILWGKDKRVAVPQTDMKNHRLNHYWLTESTQLKENRWGIPEPIAGERADESEIEVVFVPLLAYDEQGNRVGYGKGFYDQFLRKCPDRTIPVGLSFFPPEDFIEADTHDVPLQYCVTPDQIYCFRR